MAAMEAEAPINCSVPPGLRAQTTFAARELATKVIINSDVCDLSTHTLPTLGSLAKTQSCVQVGSAVVEALLKLTKSFQA